MGRQTRKWVWLNTTFENSFRAHIGYKINTLVVFYIKKEKVFKIWFPTFSLPLLTLFTCNFFSLSFMAWILIFLMYLHLFLETSHFYWNNFPFLNYVYPQTCCESGSCCPRTGGENYRSKFELAFVGMWLVEGVVKIKLCSPLVELVLQNPTGKNILAYLEWFFQLFMVVDIGYGIF